METVTDLIFLGSKITADGDCGQDIKRRLLLGRKVMTNLDSIIKSRDITLPAKVRLVKAVVFPGVVYEYESWTIKKAKHQRIDAFKLWSWMFPSKSIISIIANLQTANDPGEMFSDLRSISFQLR